MAYSRIESYLNLPKLSNTKSTLPNLNLTYKNLFNITYVKPSNNETYVAKKILINTIQLKSNPILSDVMQYIQVEKMLI